MRRLLGDWDVLSAVAVVVLAAGAAQLVGGAFQAGLSTDEPTHQSRAHSWVENGWYVPGYWVEDGAPDPRNPTASPWVYGPATAALGHLANVTVGNEELNDIADSSASYEVRHLVVALLAALAVIAVAIAVWLLTRSPALSLWGAAAMLAVPRFTGHAFFNLKDVPTASGYTLVTVGLLLALLREPGGSPSRRGQAGVAAAIAGGFLIGAGTRLSLWLPFAVAIGTYALLRLGQSRIGGVNGAKGMDLAVGAGAAVGLLGIAALYPNVARTPIELLVQSVSSSANYGYEGVFLSAGELLTAHPPIWYLPAWLGATYPVLLGGMALLGGGAGLWALGRARGAVWSRRELGMVLVLQQAAMLPLAVVLGDSPLYTGMRQHLYVLPALTILAGYGAWRSLEWARTRRPAGFWRPLATGGLCLALIVPTAAQSLLFPYNYTYFNPIAALTGGVGDRWETDYWWVSSREAVSRVPLDVPLRCTGDLMRDRLYAPLDFGECNGDRFDMADGERATDVSPEALGASGAVWVIGRSREAGRPPAWCEEADNVTRWLWGETVTMSYVLRCDPGRVAIEERREELREALTAG